MDTIPAYDVGCVSMNPWLLDSAYYFWSGDTLVIRRVVPYGSCCPSIVGLLYHSNDSILVMATDTTSGPWCLCDCSLGYSFKIPVMGDTAFLYWNGEYVPVPKPIVSTEEGEPVPSRKLNLFPNPTDGPVHIESPTTGVLMLRIRDTRGVLRHESDGSTPSLDLNRVGIEHGTYIVEVFTGSGVMRTMLIKR